MGDLWKRIQESREHVSVGTLRKVLSFPPLQAGLALGFGCSSVLFAHSFFLYKSGYYATRRFLLGFVVTTPMSTVLYMKRYQEKAALLSAHMRKNGGGQIMPTDSKRY